METRAIKNTMARDTLLYIPGKIIEGLINILTLSLYTYYLSTSDYGKYNLAILSANILFLLALNWISQSVFRYINSYRGRKKLTLLYSTVFRNWLLVCSAEILLAGAAITIYVLLSDADAYFIAFLSVTAFIFITYGTSQTLFSLLSAIRSLKLFLAMSLFSVTFKLVTTILLINLLDLGVLSALISAAAIDCITAAVIIIRVKIYKYIIPGRYSRVISHRFLGYGLPLIANGLSMSLLNVSDRYVLGLLKGTSQVGIYGANYGIAAAVFSMLNFAVMRGVYPSILQAWKKDDLKQASELLSHAVRYYLLVSLPAAMGLSILSKPIAGLFLNKEAYHAGSFVIMWVSFGMVLLGLTEYSNKAWELTSRTGAISRNSVICGLYNLVSNLVFIPLFGYAAAAVNTTLSYLVYFCLSYFKGRKILKWELRRSTVLKLAAANITMVLTLLTVLSFVKPGKLELAALVAAGGLIYGVVLYITGEIKAEAKSLANMVKGMINKRKIS